MVILISNRWLTSDLPGFSCVTLLFSFSLFNFILWRWVTKPRPFSGCVWVGRGIDFHVLEGRTSTYIWNFSVRKIWLFSLIFFIQSFILSKCTHVYLFYSWGYNPRLLFILLIKLLQLQPLGAPLGWLLGPFDMSPFISLLRTSFLVLQDAPSSSSVLPAPALASVISPRSPGFSYSKMAFRNQGDHQFLTPSLVK